jgi:hypothetical protein
MTTSSKTSASQSREWETGSDAGSDAGTRIQTSAASKIAATLGEAAAQAAQDRELLATAQEILNRMRTRWQRLNAELVQAHHDGANTIEPAQRVTEMAESLGFDLDWTDLTTSEPWPPTSLADVDRELTPEWTATWSEEFTPNLPPRD